MSSPQRPSDRRFRWILSSAAGMLVLLMGAIGGMLLLGAWPVLKSAGPAFFVRTDWDPVQQSFGAAAFLYGTVVSSLLALLFSVPVSIGVALFLSEIAPAWIARPIQFLVEMLAAIPSVIYGLWGVFILAPFLRDSVEPWAIEHLGEVLPFFQGPPFGVGMLAAGLILAIMITPTIASITRELFQTVSMPLREAALGLGATRLEMVRLAILPSVRSGLIGAVILGLGRAFGETMAVTMVIGNRNEISASLFAPAQTMASVIANEYAEASEPAHLAALSCVGLMLLLLSLSTQVFARLWRSAE